MPVKPRAKQRNDRASRDNPYVHVAFQAKDQFGVESRGGGGTEFVPVTPALRNRLRKSLSAAVEASRRDLSIPDVPAVLVLELRSEAIAKTHRPTTLAAESQALRVGHGALNEMLIAADASAMVALDRVIQSRTTKAIRENLSTLEGIHSWGMQRRLPSTFRDLDAKALHSTITAAAERVLVRLFSYASEETSKKVLQRFLEFLKRYNLSAEQLSQRSGAPVFLVPMKQLTKDQLVELLRFPAVRRIMPEPQVHSSATQVATPSGAHSLPLPDPDLPVVGVFDSGVAPKLKSLAPWIAGRDTYVLPPDTNYEHGTYVASLIACAAHLNEEDNGFPRVPCRVHDVAAAELGGTRLGDLILRLRTAIAKQPNVHIWNLSIATASEVSDEEFSEFARELDNLSDQHNVLFVVSAGNYVAQPRRTWPASDGLLDRLASPGDSVRALTVGAAAHRANAVTLVQSGEPAPYSRRGPGPVFTPKPDVVHFGGNATTNWESTGVGVRILHPSGKTARVFGTSYSAPVVAALAAHTWRDLEGGTRRNPIPVSPTLVKALIVHAAELNSPPRTARDRRYFGAGIPSDPVGVLYDSDSSFTLMFEIDLVDGAKWRKAPYPIPESLLVNGKLRAEVIMTCAYAPPLNGDAGAEYVRFNVSIGFGTLEQNKKGIPEFAGQLPGDHEEGSHGFESAQIEHGGKWAPVKVFRRSMKNGVAGNTWAVQASVLRREFEPILTKPMRAVVLVTLRSLDDNPNVYADGRRALQRSGWITQTLPTGVSINI
ncbi:S8 family anti-phage peptidase IteS [Pandoraea sp. NPDC087047]|uniref:S8 family anti-phage peptidase IteS n=1 Tax=Pandoraea sp. NPDC087047 TaxID=3364390 RepID=UPI003803B98A